MGACDMTLQQLIYFREVARLRHFTRAADSLYVAQSSLSHAIHLLEDELGVPLFVRQCGKKVELTQYGEAFLPYVDRIMGELDQAKAHIEQMRNPEGGIVNVVYSYVNGYSLIPPAIRAFHDSPCNTDIEVRVEINHGTRFFEKEMEAGKVDISFSAGAHVDGLASVPIAEQRLYVMVPAEDPLAARGSISLEDLDDKSMLMFIQGRHLHRWLQEMYAFSGMDFSPIEFYDDWSEVMAAVALGQGCVISPKLPVDPELVKVIPLEHPMNVRSIYMHWQEGIRLSRPVEIFRDFCTEYFLEQNGGRPIVPKFDPEI